MKRRIQLELRNQTWAVVCELVLNNCKSNDRRIEVLTDESVNLRVPQFNNWRLGFNFKSPQTTEIEIALDRDQQDQQVRDSDAKVDGVGEEEEKEEGEDAEDEDGEEEELDDEEDEWEEVREEEEFGHAGEVVG